MTTIFAIGGDEVGPVLLGGKIKKVITENIHKEIIDRTGKKHPKVLYIPTAKDDSEEYIEGFSYYYKKLGCSEVDILRLIKQKPTKEKIEAKIFAADAIYIGGGNSQKMIAIWKRYGIDIMLKKALVQGTVMAGHSAGAICWFKYGCSDSYGRKPFRVAAMGVINAVTCPHYDTEPVRQAALEKIMKRTPHFVAIALDECATIEITDKSYRIIASQPLAKAYKTYWRNGNYNIEEIKQTHEYQDLNELLTKVAN